MKKIILTLLLALSFTSKAGIITTNLETTEVAENGKISVEINGSDFVETDMFWFDFKFDTSIFKLTLDSISSSLNLVNTASGMFDGLEIIERSFGLEFTYSDPTPVVGSFNVAKFELTALKAGNSDFAVTDIDGFPTDFSVADYSAAYGNGQSVAVAAVAANVSEPSSIAFLLMSVTGLLLLNRRKQNASKF